MTKHDKIIAVLCALAFALLIVLSIREAEAQVSNQQCTQEKDQQTTSGLSGTLTFPDSCGTRINTFEVKVNGAPATVAVTINGCMRGGTCTQLATSSSTSNSIITASGGPFDNLQVVFTLTGGTSPTLNVNRTAATGMAGLGPTTTGQPVIVGAGGALLSSSATYDLSNPVWQDPGGDACKTINNALTAIVTAAQFAPYVIWSVPGKFACASNPFNGSPANTFAGTLQITPGANFWLSGTSSWVQPAGSTITGNGYGGFAQLGTNGFSLVACQATNQASICKGAFPIDTPLFCMISCLQNFNYAGGGKDTNLWYATLDCGWVQGCRAFMDYYTQENSGAHWVYPQNFSPNGIGLDLNQSTVAGNIQNSSFEGIATTTQNGPSGATQVCSFGSLPIRIGMSVFSQAGPRVVRDVSANDGLCAVTNNIFFNHDAEINGCCMELLGWHAEGNGSDALELGVMSYMGTMNCVAATCTWVSGDILASGNGWPTGCSGTFMVGTPGTFFTVSACGTANSVTFTASPAAGNQPYVFDNTGQAGCTPSCVFGASHVIISNLWDVATGSAGVQGTNLCGTCVPGVVGFGPSNLNNDQSNELFDIFAGVPNRATNIILDPFNSTITSGQSVSADYILDASNRVVLDSTGKNTIFWRNPGLKSPVFQSVGTKFTATGCTAIANTHGGAAAGDFTIGQAGACVVTITIAGAAGFTTITGWSCTATDVTPAIPLAVPMATGSTTTTALLAVPAAAGNGDKIVFGCQAY